MSQVDDTLINPLDWIISVIESSRLAEGGALIPSKLVLMKFLRIESRYYVWMYESIGVLVVRVFAGNIENAMISKDADLLSRRPSLFRP